MIGESLQPENSRERDIRRHALVELKADGIRPVIAAEVAIKHELDVAPRTRSERELLTLILNTARAHLDLRLAPGDAPPQSSLESLQRYLFSDDGVPILWMKYVMAPRSVVILTRSR